MTFESCQCEHQAHPFKNTEPSVKTPNMNPGHDYGAKFNAELLRKVMYGLWVCPDCYNDCMADYHLYEPDFYTFWREIVKLFQWFGDRAWHEQKQKLPPNTERPKFKEITVRDDGIVEVELGEDFEGYTREA